MIFLMCWACGISIVFCTFGSWGPVGVYRHVHDLLESPLLHWFPQRLDSLPTGCCVCAARVDAAGLHPGKRVVTGIPTGLHGIGLLEHFISLML